MFLRAQASVDVSGSVPIDGELTLALSIISSAGLDPARSPVVVFAFPGGGYGRGYYDLSFPGFQGYSEAEYHAERGWVVVACDHLGVGDSTAVDMDKLTIEMLAAANDAAVRGALERLAAGTLADGLPPLRPAAVIGEGQSMGGLLTVVAQARHRTFDAVAVLGSSGIQTVVPSPGGRADVPQGEVSDSGPGIFAYSFHWDDEPAELVAADFSGGYPVRTTVPAWGSATIPTCAASMLEPGIIAEETAAVDVPVFVGCGERDVVPDPWAEPAAYRGSRDITVLVLPRMAHMHNFAATRQRLWERLHGWGEQVRPRDTR